MLSLHPYRLNEDTIILSYKSGYYRGIAVCVYKGDNCYILCRVKGREIIKPILAKGLASGILSYCNRI